MNAWTEQLLKLANIQVVKDPVSGSTKFEFIAASIASNAANSTSSIDDSIDDVLNASVHSVNSLASQDSNSNNNVSVNSISPKRNKKGRSHHNRRKKERSSSETEATMISSGSPTSIAKALGANSVAPNPSPPSSSPLTAKNTAPISDEKQPTIRWGQVEEVCFPVQVAESAVPTNGCFPLGMAYSSDVSKSCDRSICSVEEHVVRRQVELLLRARALPPSLLISLPYCASVGSSSSRGVEEVYETRQYDHKNGIKNPLFECVSEVTRIAILSSTAANTHSSSSHSSSSHPHSESAVDTFEHVSEINKEIKAIHISRDKIGCTCKPVKIDKLSVAKMRSEVHTHLSSFPELQKKDIEGLSKGDLMARVKELYRDRCLCADHGCECVADGVGCSDQSCLCVGKGSKLCFNPFGSQAYDLDKVDRYRRELISSVSASNLRSDTKRSHSVVH